MEKKVIHKVPNGKLLKVIADVDNGILVSVQITGDFFVYPEEELYHLEQLLRFQPLDKQLLLYMIESYLKQNNVQFYGITPDALSDALMQCGDS
ncbi:MAG: hypothetical protein AABX98_02295 [Nanoarchaeota archaeon]